MRAARSGDALARGHPVQGDGVGITQHQIEHPRVTGIESVVGQLLAAAVETDRRDKKLNAYAEFLKCARSYRHAIRPYAVAITDIHDVDVLAQATFAAGSFLFLVGESTEALAACRKILGAIGESQELLHDPDHPSREAHWPGANEAIELSLRQFQVAVREELGVSGIEKSWILTRGKTMEQTAGM